MLRSLVILLAVAPVAVAAPVPKHPTTPLEGVWELDPDAEQMKVGPIALLSRIVVKGDSLTYHFSGEGRSFASPHRFTLDAAASPRRIDITPTADHDRNKGQPSLGLYQLADEKLRLCTRAPWSTRPTDFNDTRDGTDGTTYLNLRAVRK